MARTNEDDDDEEDFSLEGDSEEQDDDDEDASFGEEDGDDSESGDDDAESDFEEVRPVKRAKTTSSDSAKKPTKTKTKTPATKPAASATMRERTVKTTAATTKKDSRLETSSAPSGTANKKRPAAAARTPPTEAIKGDAATHVLEYMRKMNRPYSVLNVFENLHRAVAKPALTRVLDKLVDKGELVSKTYGKTKIYCMNQDRLPVPSEQERAQTEARIKQVEAEVASAEQELKTSEAQLSKINAQMTDAELEKALADLESESSTLEAKLATLERPGQAPVSPGRKDALKRKFGEYRTAWIKRKRSVMDAVNQIADGMEKKPTVIIELLGLETDADAGIKEIPSL